MVFDVTNGAQGNNLLFASTSIDITRDIISLYDQTAAAAPAAKTSETPAPAAARRPAAPAPAAPAAK
jgi:hypothetical protein